MGKFLEVEKGRQILFRETSEYFTDAAKADGVYLRKPRRFCLPVDRAEENLFGEIRASALEYFARKQIDWHHGRDGRPSNHLCSSQVQCVNFLYPFSERPDALCALLQPIFPTIHSVIPMEYEHVVSFEWIGLRNYLGEKVPRSGSRTRGANSTSADAAIMFRHNDGTRQLTLIEWKYTESYNPVYMGVASMVYL